jgi:hypothetical protein
MNSWAHMSALEYVHDHLCDLPGSLVELTLEHHYSDDNMATADGLPQQSENFQRAVPL